MSLPQQPAAPQSAFILMDRTAESCKFGFTQESDISNQFKVLIEFWPKLSRPRCFSSLHEAHAPTQENYDIRGSSKPIKVALESISYTNNHGFVHF